jgi:superfamily II DNA or RNA helicase
VPLGFRASLGIEPRPYQEAALQSWRDAGRRGVVVLPTGAGKTAVGALAVLDADTRTLVLVPTIDLVKQWQRALRETIGAPAENVQLGFPGDDGSAQLSLLPWEPPDILIATYAGASRHTDDLHHFGLLIFDEAHHLPAPVFRTIATEAVAPYRLGLTATPERYDGAEADLDDLIGPAVYRETARDLADGYLAAHSLHTRYVDLEPAERTRYDEGWKAYIGYVRRARLRMPQGYSDLIKRAGRDGAARKALEGHRQAREIALSGRRKIDAVRELLAEHRGERTLIFCQHVALAGSIGAALDLPVVTHETPRPARAAALAAFRSGELPILVATSILDEGVDVPDASIGIVVSGTGQGRQFVQRLGRILRPTPGKEARLYEIVTRDTLEERTAKRRRAAGTSSGPKRPPARPKR